MKKLFTLIIISAMLAAMALCLFGCGKKSEKLVLGFDADFPPYGYEEDGKFVGFDIEYAEKVCANLGYELELKPIDWDAKDTLLESGAIDFIWNGFTYEGRENGYEWTVRYLDNSIVVLTLDSSITSLSDLAGKKVAVQSDSSGEAALEENTELTSTFKGGAFSLEADYTTAYTKLKAGSYDAVVVDIGVAKYLKSADAGLIIVSEEVSKETYAVGFKKGNTDLCKKISDEMVNVAKDTAFIQSLCDKYGVDYNSFLLK